MDSTFDGTCILIWSENPDELMKFYRDILKLKINEKVDIPNDYGYEFQLTPTTQLWIGKHSDVNGISKEPVRIMHNLYANDVQKWFETVKNAGCTILSEPVKVPFYLDSKPWYVCTFLDPEGNCWQFMGEL